MPSESLTHANLSETRIGNAVILRCNGQPIPISLPKQTYVNFCDATIDDAAMISEFVSALALQIIAPSLTDAGTETLLASMDFESTPATQSNTRRRWHRKIKSFIMQKVCFIVYAYT